MQTRRTSAPWRRRPWVWALGLVAIFALVLAIRPLFAAQPAASDGMSAPSAQAESVLARAEDVAAGRIIEANLTAQEEEAPVSAAPAESPQESLEQNPAPAVAVAPNSDNCIACHTNQDVLQTLAEAPEEVHSTEASGEG